MLFIIRTTYQKIITAKTLQRKTDFYFSSHKSSSELFDNFENIKTIGTHIIKPFPVVN